MNPIELNLFANRLESICDEMGAALRNAAFSPNIRDRLDFSCAIFDAAGALCAQAAHIPVHLGSMAFAMASIVNRMHWQPGDQVILNDPYLGGTHLPDVTLIAPVFYQGRLLGFVVNRAHHADIGGDSPGSMPISRSLLEEGIIIEPDHLLCRGILQERLWEHLLGATGNRQESEGDLAAQLSANKTGAKRLEQLLATLGIQQFKSGLDALNDYAARLAHSALMQIPDGEYAFSDCLDDDGQGNQDISIRVNLSVKQGSIDVDFSGTSDQVEGNINCPLAVAAAAVYYVFRCLMPDHTPACAGAFRGIEIKAPGGCLLNATHPAAVAAGNVETSSRVVDVIMGALAKAVPDRMAAASQGSMNNVAMGSAAERNAWDYYETIGGGMGAHASGDGLSGVQTHMTNTLNTPVEVLERRYPLRVQKYGLRIDSGGRGWHAGGDGIIREFCFLAPAEVSLLTERRAHRPWGLSGGSGGRQGRNLLNGVDLPGKCRRPVLPGDVLTIETPGGGGWGSDESNNQAESSIS